MTHILMSDGFHIKPYSRPDNKAIVAKIPLFVKQLNVDCGVLAGQGLRVTEEEFDRITGQTGPYTMLILFYPVILSKKPD